VSASAPVQTVDANTNVASRIFLNTLSRRVRQPRSKYSLKKRSFNILLTPFRDSLGPISDELSRRLRQEQHVAWQTDRESAGVVAFDVTSARADGRRRLRREAAVEHRRSFLLTSSESLRPAHERQTSPLQANIVFCVLGSATLYDSVPGLDAFVQLLSLPQINGR
jgi:hypothetical protein